MGKGHAPESRLERFIACLLRETDPAAFGPVKGRLVKLALATVIVCRGFLDDQCLLRASALTFSTLLAIVPLFALAFAVLKGLGVQNTLEPFILEQVAAGSHEIVDRIVTYINNTQVASLGAVGLVTLVVTAVTLLANIEEAFNAVWGVRETRSLYRKFSDYLSVLVSGPLLIFAAMSVTTTLQSQQVVQWLIRSTYFGGLLVPLFHLVPYLSIWLALVFLYLFIPNTKVRIGSALVGGVIAGTLWQAAQWGYIHFQVGVARYNAIYGTLAVLPVFMVWLYASWIIVLFGVEVVYAHQHLGRLRQEVRVPSLSSAARERIALAAMVEIARAFFRDLPPWSAERLAERLDVPERILRDILDRLADDGWVAAGCGDAPGYLPARELEHIELAEFLASLRSQGGAPQREGKGDDPLVSDILGRMEGAVVTAVGGRTFRDLMETEHSGT